jgi:CheY-like chemotaxis protein
MTITDSGVGIDAATLPHIFDRFRQGDRSAGSREGGLGLGLALVRHFLELHGGTVSAWSAGKGRGSTFTVRLPVAAVRITDRRRLDRTETDAPSFGEGLLKGIRVVVVDDDRDSRDLICEVLRGAGATVFAAASAGQALGTLVVEHPDAIVSDLGMPGEDGFALIKRVRTLPDPRLAGVPALALSAHTRSADQRIALAAGFTDHLAKPVEPAKLVDAVLRLVLATRSQ